MYLVNDALRVLSAETRLAVYRRLRVYEFVLNETIFPWYTGSQRTCGWPSFASAIPLEAERPALKLFENDTFDVAPMLLIKDLKTARPLPHESMLSDHSFWRAHWALSGGGLHSLIACLYFCEFGKYVILMLPHMLQCHDHSSAPCLWILMKI